VRPRQVRYQAALRPDKKGAILTKALSNFPPAPIHGFLASTARLPRVFSFKQSQITIRNSQ
jgi:hypothetical protein